MKFGLFYELQLPRPWEERSEETLYEQALDQVELADQMGIDYVWAVEHHFLEEHSHLSAPEVFLGACSQRTRRIRLGHGIMVMTPPYSHPARSAERIATLDVISHGRAEWGTGESSAALEIEGFRVDPADKRAMWEESVRQAADMLVSTPYPGYAGRYFAMPPRNVVPKPVQKPHPPLWLGCSRRETIHRAARLGVGALAFGFVEPEQAAQWVREYYDIIRSDQCVTIGHAVNANVAVLCAMGVHQEGRTALRDTIEGFRFLGYTLGWNSIYGRHLPGRTDLWRSFTQAGPRLPEHAGPGAVGTPAEVRDHLRRYEDAGVDQVILVQQAGRARHTDICASLRLFAASVMPEFAGRDADLSAMKASGLQQAVTAAAARRIMPARQPDSTIAVVEAFGLRTTSAEDGKRARDMSGRGGGIPVPDADPHSR